MSSVPPKPLGNIPMWDSSDPARSPAPLPLNPNPNSPQVSPVRSEHRPTTPTGSPKKQFDLDSSPTRTSQTVLTHRRMNSLQTTTPTTTGVSVREMGNLLLNGGKNTPSGNKNRSTSPQKDLFSSPPPLLPPLRSMRSLENSHHPFSSTDLESLSHQLVGLTNIANNLQKEMAQLSRRSKDNATDLISLREATVTRDEDIRHSLRELVQGIGMMETGASSNTPLLLRAPSPSVASSGASSHGGSMDGDSGGGGLGRTGRTGGGVGDGGRGFGDRFQFNQGVGALITKLNHGPGSSHGGTAAPPQGGFSKMGMEMQVLERILRDMSTKDGENRIMDSLFELRKSVGSKNGEREILGLLGDVREEVTNISEDLQKRLSSMGGQLDVIPSKQSFSKDLERSDDVLRILERIAKEVMSGKGLTDETKSTVLHINDEVENGRMATEQLKNELLGLKADFLNGKAASEESNNLVIDLKHEIQAGKGATDETRDIVNELKEDARSGREIMDEVKAFVKGMKEKIESSKLVADETRDGVADLKGDVRGSRGVIDETKDLVVGLKDHLTDYERETGENIKLVLQEVERITASQKQLQTTGGEPVPQPTADRGNLDGAATVMLPRIDHAISELHHRFEEFCEETAHSSGDNKAQMMTLMKFLDDLTQNTAVQFHESREFRKLFEVVRMGVQSMNDRLVTFETEVFTRLDDGVGAVGVTKNFEGEETIKERRRMWKEVREDIDVLRTELSEIAIAMERNRNDVDDVDEQRRQKADDAILEILKYQKRGGEMLHAQGELYQGVSGQVAEVKTLIEEQVLRGILAAQKAGSEMLVAHRGAGEEVKREVLGLRTVIEDQVLHHLLETQLTGGSDLGNELSSIKKLIQDMSVMVMENQEVQMLGDQVKGSIGEVKNMLGGVVGQVLDAQNTGRDGFKAEIAQIRKLLDHVVGQVLEKQKGFGMGVLEVIKEVKKIVTDKVNSKPHEEVLVAIEEVKRLTERSASSDDRDTVLRAIGGLQGVIEGRTASRAVQDELLDTMIEIQKKLDDKTMEGNYLGALADLKEFLEEKDFDKSRQDSNIHNLILGSIADVKRTVTRLELGEDLLSAVNDVKHMLEEKQVVRAQQIAREDELKQNIAMILRVLEEGVIRAIVHLQRDLGDGIRGDMAEVKEQGNDVRADVSEMRRILEDDVKGKMLDVKIILEDEIKEELSSVKKILDEDLKVDIGEVKRTLGKNHLAGVESHKKTHESLKEVLETVGDLQTELKGSQYKQSNNFQELKTLIQQSTQPASKSEELAAPPPTIIQYDDQQIQEKLDKVIIQGSTSTKYLAQIEELQARLTEVATQVTDFISLQSSLVQESSTKQVEAAGQAILALEKAKAERAIVEQSTAALREQESVLMKTNEALREETSLLTSKKHALGAELAAIEATLTIRREQLDKMSDEADAIQRRVVEGVLEQSRALAIARGRRDTGAQALKRINSNRSASSMQQLAPAALANNTPRRHLSLSQIASKSPSVVAAAKKSRPSMGGAGLAAHQDIHANINPRSQLSKSASDEQDSFKEDTGSDGGSTMVVTRTGGGLASVEDWDEGKEAEELEGEEGSGGSVGGGTRKSKTYPASLGAGISGRAATSTALARRDLSEASMGSIDE